jgi:hypothetical protein
MESTTLVIIVVGASIGLFGIVLSDMIKTFQEVRTNTALY